MYEKKPRMKMCGVVRMNNDANLKFPVKLSILLKLEELGELWCHLSLHTCRTTVNLSQNEGPILEDSKTVKMY